MDYKVIYSSRRTVALSIKDGELIVRAPFGTSSAKIEEIISQHLDWVIKNTEKWHRRNAKYENLTDEDIQGLREKAKLVLPVKVDYYSKIMGINHGRITITGAKTRFGSCSSKRNISFSYRLMLYPEEAIDYVVVHELAHILEMNHSKNFYKIIAKILPDYKERQKLLKK